MKDTRKAFILSAMLTVLGAGMLYLYILKAEEELSGGPKMLVVYASQDIPVGSPLQKEMLATREVPRIHADSRQVPVSDVDSILGVHTSVPLDAGSFVLWTDLAHSIRGTRSLASLIPKGQRAVTLPVDASSSFSGMLRPGDRVDVLRTKNTEEHRKTETILQNVMVAAVGSETRRETAEGSYDGAPTSSSSVTLALSPKNAQRMIHARTLGNLSLALRNPDDIRTTSSESYEEPLRRNGDKDNLNHSIRN